MSNSKLELSESGPSKLEWLLAFIVMVIPFMSFCYGDTACFIMYELRFAQAILHGNLKEAYEPIVKVTSAMGWEVSSLSYYDLPLNLVFGIWGIPLYLYSARNGSLDITFPDSFWQMLYGKSVLLIAFIISAVLVYKICIALGLSRNRSRWGAYIYFSSSMAVSAVGIIGQCDVFAICLTLSGVLAYLRNQDKRFLFWFVIAAQFKQFALFIFLPLLLLRDKNLLSIAAKTALIILVGLLCNVLILHASPSALKARAGFTALMTAKLLKNKLPLFHTSVSLFILAFGALCIYCWLHEFKDKADKSEVDSQTVFISLLSMVVLFTTFPSYPYWYIHMTPYLAIAAVYHSRNTDKILLFEAIGLAAVVGLNYIIYDWCYSPNNSVNMLLHNLLGNPALMTRNEALKAAIRSVVGSAASSVSSSTGAVQSASIKLSRVSKAVNGIRPVLQAVYLVCMYTIVWLTYPKNYVLGGRHCRIRQYVMLRLLFNTLVCSIPIIIIFIAPIRS